MVAQRVDFGLFDLLQNMSKVCSSATGLQDLVPFGAEDGAPGQCT